MTADSDAEVERLLAEYLEQEEGGANPDPDAIAQRLGSEAQRREFDARLRCITWLRQLLPARIDTDTMIADRYELLEQLGSGGSGTVWRALDRQDQRHVAVKLLNVRAGADAFLERYHQHEMQALMRLEHPGVVRIHASGDQQGTPYIVMDLLHGRSLAAVIADLAKGRTITDLDGDDYYSSVTRVVVEVLRAVEAAHAAQILHRDIKPANIMLTEGARPVLLDFGLASLIDEATGTLSGRLAGTANYVAPEQIRDHSIGRSPLTDVYQVGLVLYELLVLRPAFAPEHGLGLPDRILHGEFERPRSVAADVPEALDAICLHALNHTPERRFESAAAFRRSLEHWLDSGEAPPGLQPKPIASDPDPDDPQRFQIRKELLRNEFEVVQLAWDGVLERDVVLKRAGPGLWSPHTRSRVKREARNLIRVDHPGIVRLFDVIDIDSDLVLVMEPLRGRPLGEYLNGPLPVAETVALGIALADAMHALHAVGIVHCCLGPETVWIADDGAPAISGFTFARDLEGSTVSTIGFHRERPEAPAQAYLAPEQHEGRRPDERADVFALGCLLYRCLAGEDPGSGDEAPDPYAGRNDVTRPLARVIARCLHSARTERFGSMREVATALRGL